VLYFIGENFRSMSKLKKQLFEPMKVQIQHFESLLYKLKSINMVDSGNSGDIKIRF
jgi:hypothetical protein